MARTPDFDRITDSVTQADIDNFLRSAGPKDFKEEVQAATDQRTKMRFVAGYLIRTNQVTAARLAGKAALSAPDALQKVARRPRSTARGKAGSAKG